MRRLDVAFLSPLVARLGKAYPETGLVIAGDVITSAASIVDTLGNAGDGQDVMPDFVRDDVGIGEIAATAEALLHLGEKDEVDGDLLVAGATERANRRTCLTAGGVDCALEQHQPRRQVLLVAELCAPRILGRAEDGADELAPRIVRACGLVPRQALKPPPR